MPSALITQQLAYLNTQDFNIVYITRKKNIITNALLQKPKLEGQEPLLELEEDINNLINSTINLVVLYLPNYKRLLYLACSINTLFKGYLLDKTYLEEFQVIAQQILFQQRPKELVEHQLTKFKKKALQFIIQD